MIDIKKIANTLIRGEKAIVFPLQIHSGWISDQNGHHILDIRGWGFIQYLGEGAEKLQDDIGYWVVEALNRAYYEQSLFDEIKEKHGDHVGDAGTVVDQILKLFPKYENRI